MELVIRLSLFLYIIWYIFIIYLFLNLLPAMVERYYELSLWSMFCISKLL